MIIVKLTGGLGNQMFQYALGRQIALKNNCLLKLDISGFETYKLHDYTLGNFNIIEHIAGPIERFFLNRPLGKILKTYIEESSPGFQSEVLAAGPNAYLEGYWQSERYFLDISDVIKREFTLRAGLSNEMARIADLLKGKDSVSVHIRRGDYAKKKSTRKVHGLCTPEYYYQALKIITGKIKDPKLFIFSDDIDWVKDNLKFENFSTTFVSDGNTKIKNYEEFILISLCKHNITANSTFSWWGAWLNKNPDKIVIVPKDWFADKTKNNKDLIPDSWIQT